ncbi:MAG: dCTP deaminase, partial [archaeon]
NSNETMILKPGDFVLATTLEWIEIPSDLSAQVCGKSTWARKGLIVEMAGFIDPGFTGNITLEIKNIGCAPIILRHKDLICQIKFNKLTSECSKPYSGKYLGQTGVTGARKEIE